MSFSLPVINDGNRRWWTLGAMCFALFMVMLDNTVVNVALPAIQRDLQVAIGGLEWTVNAYTLTFAVLLVTGGRLGDIFGRRRIFLVGVAVFGLSSLFISASQSSAWLIAGRTAQGVGAALMMPATLSIISNAFPPNERGKAIGTWAGASAVALAIGPLVGGFLVEHVSWQSIFLINVPIAAAAILVTLWAARESRDEGARHVIDVPGVAAISIGLAAFVLALVEANSWGWGSPATLALFAAGALGLTAFAVIEHRAEEPMVDFAFFRSRSFLGANVVAFIVSFAMLAMFFFLALYLQNVRGYSPLEAGVRFLPATLVIMLTAPIAGRLADRIGPRTPMVAGLVFASLSLFVQARLEVDTRYGLLAGAFALMGLGMGLVMSPMSTAAMNAVHHSKTGVASGVLSMSRMVGGTFGIAVLGALVSAISSARIADGLAPSTSPAVRERLEEAAAIGAPGVPGQAGELVHQAFLDAVNAGLKLGAAVALVGALVSWWLISPRVPPAHEELPGVERVPLDLVEAGDTGGAPQGEAAMREMSSPARTGDDRTRR